jgi:hypothetical protein
VTGSISSSLLQVVVLRGFRCQGSHGGSLKFCRFWNCARSGKEPKPSERGSDCERKGSAIIAERTIVGHASRVETLRTAAGSSHGWENYLPMDGRARLVGAHTIQQSAKRWASFASHTLRNTRLGTIRIWSRTNKALQVFVFILAGWLESSAMTRVEPCQSSGFV